MVGLLLRHKEKEARGKMFQRGRKAGTYERTVPGGKEEAFESWRELET